MGILSCFLFAKGRRDSKYNHDVGGSVPHCASSCWPSVAAKREASRQPNEQASEVDVALLLANVDCAPEQNQTASARRLNELRDILIAGQSPSIITIFSRDGRIVHQTPHSKRYYGEFSEHREENVIATVFGHEPNKLERMLAEVSRPGGGGIWKAVVRVPRTLNKKQATEAAEHGAAPTCHGGGLYSDSTTGSDLGSTLGCAGRACCNPDGRKAPDDAGDETMWLLIETEGNLASSGAQGRDDRSCAGVSFRRQATAPTGCSATSRAAALSPFKRHSLRITEAAAASADAYVSSSFTSGLCSTNKALDSRAGGRQRPLAGFVDGVGPAASKVMEDGGGSTIAASGASAKQPRAWSSTATPFFNIGGRGSAKQPAHPELLGPMLPSRNARSYTLSALGRVSRCELHAQVAGLVLGANSSTVGGARSLSSAAEADLSAVQDPLATSTFATIMGCMPPPAPEGPATHRPIPVPRAPETRRLPLASGASFSNGTAAAGPESARTSRPRLLRRTASCLSSSEVGRRGSSMVHPAVSQAPGSRALAFALSLGTSPLATPPASAATATTGGPSESTPRCDAQLPRVQRVMTATGPASGPTKAPSPAPVVPKASFRRRQMSTIELGALWTMEAGLAVLREDPGSDSAPAAGQGHEPAAGACSAGCGGPHGESSPRCPAGAGGGVRRGQAVKVSLSSSAPLSRDAGDATAHTAVAAAAAISTVAPAASAAELDAVRLAAEAPVTEPLLEGKDGSPTAPAGQALKPPAGRPVGGGSQRRLAAPDAGPMGRQGHSTGGATSLGVATATKAVLAPAPAAAARTGVGHGQMPSAGDTDVPTRVAAVEAGGRAAQATALAAPIAVTSGPGGSYVTRASPVSEAPGAKVSEAPGALVPRSAAAGSPHPVLSSPPGASGPPRGKGMEAEQVEGEGEEAEEEEEAGEEVPAAEPECWHEIWATQATDPVTGQGVIIVTQVDVTAKVIAERHLALVMEAEHRLVEQLFPRHILQFVTEEWTTWDSPGGGGGSCRMERGRHWRPVVCDDDGHLATSHREVTLLFADIKGFTPACEQLQPRQVMALLNALYSRYDAMLDEYGVYKVETIGDCYFVAGGLIREDEDGMAAVREGCSSEDPEHAQNVFAFARAMLAAARQVLMPHTGQPVEIRIGMHTGPVVSGVVGTRMPRFCLFGDTVNTASRMESMGTPGAIHASEATYRRLPHSCQWEPTGGIEVKGKGLMQTYRWRPRLEQPPPELVAAAAADGPEEALSALPEDWLAVLQCPSP